jgi:hypothetical protein
MELKGTREAHSENVHHHEITQYQRIKSSGPSGKCAYELDEDWKKARYQSNHLSKGISISIIKIILIINRFNKELIGKVLYLTVKELVDL